MSGDVNLQGAQAEEANFSSVSGDMTWDGVIQGATMKTTSGSITVVADQAPDRMSLSAVSGDVTIYMPLETRFGVIYHTTSGTIGATIRCLGLQAERSSTTEEVTWSTGWIPSAGI